MAVRQDTERHLRDSVGDTVEASAAPAGSRRSQASKSRAFEGLIERDPAVARAVSFLAQRGVSTGLRSKKVSTRVDPGVMDAAKKRFGLSNESDVINASLAMAAAPDRVKTWLQGSSETVTDDFELAV